MRTYLIVNHKTKLYQKCELDAQVAFEGDWKENYPHTKGADCLDVEAVSIWEIDMVNGIPYNYDLCCGGMLATLWVDTDDFSREDVDKAKSLLRQQQDVVTLKVIKLKKYVQGEMLVALKMCVLALYEAIEIAPLDRIPSKAGEALQQAQYIISQSEVN